MVAAPAASVITATTTSTRRRLGLLSYTAALLDGQPLEFELDAHRYRSSAPGPA